MRATRGLLRPWLSFASRITIRLYPDPLPIVDGTRLTGSLSPRGRGSGRVFEPYEDSTRTLVHGCERSDYGFRKLL